MIALTKTETEFELSPTLAINELVVKKRAEGKEILHMGFGESPFPVPHRLAEALKNNTHHKQYLPTAGLPELREAVASYYAEKVGVDTSAYDVLIAPGSKLIIYSLQMAVDGDFIMPVPSWVSYAPQAKMLGRNVIKMPTTLDDDGMHLNADTLRTVIKDAREAGLKPSKILLNYPSNPTGLSIPDHELEAIARVCEEEDILIISDEIYGFVNHQRSYQSISRFAPNHTAISSGLSKHLSLGGWRIGICFIPKAIDGMFSRMTNIASELWSCVPAPIQVAAIEAYKGHADIEEHVAACSELHSHMNRYISDELKALGIKAPTPQGAFYNYPDFEEHRDALKNVGVETSKDLAQVLLEKYEISSLPGVAFGADANQLTLRLSGCDYDGAAALAQLMSLRRENHAYALDEDFIKQYAPRVYKAGQVFKRFINDTTGSI
ncbi:pyridoxal phosphate-dependent aminotransferase [Alteromonas sp. a30]|uniref:pyridoxal phosphate-dependent aminotransferase n=1 Tax=Alteromonas sp. a30 TaxID=2730917 RepID=UPI0022803B8A|nr:aminotransferase class I/II-fold pyridoxal phosphate-dependent enzyme [Alteromonas sp. a30]MCY7294452.1 aminotransferase class I/II-fold pyridoxal phosphate-dependent enzyme [Alteromonas sp. a30]